MLWWRIEADDADIPAADTDDDENNNNSLKEKVTWAWVRFLWSVCNHS
jgi:hypothetical protein